MTPPSIASYGAWKSPLTADVILASSIGLGAIALDGEDIYWLESRPSEKGRNVLVRYQANGEHKDVTPAPFNVRTRVHEYGGGAFLVRDGIIYFSNFGDRRIYRQVLGQNPEPLTPKNSLRYADFVLDEDRNRLIAVGEDHQREGQEPENLLVTIDLNSGDVAPLLRGSDFYTSPRLSPNHQQLAWISWEHPNLPWDSTQLWLADISPSGALEQCRCIAGQDQIESINEPKWSPEGQLYFSSDRSGWWNLYRLDAETIEALYPLEAEFAYPHWVFGLSTYVFSGANQISCTYNQGGYWHLAQLDLDTKKLTSIPTDYSNFSCLASNGKTLLFLGSSPTQASMACAMELSNQKTKILKRSSDLELDPGYLSIPEALSFPTENGHIAHAWYYPPQNKDFQAIEAELPPLLVKSHGGPTAQASNSLSLRVQYWTSRGFGYLDVNYGGSTGYGRAYRQRLDGAWGVVDVADCIHGAQFLVNQGRVDGNKLVISGGSAGGYTTLAALTFHDCFKAGASYYGVSDLEALARDTEKFESRYLDRLIGKYPEEIDLYQRRSPINFTEQLSCPVVFFQGLEDKVVPPNQTEMMVEALQAKGLPVAYVLFPEEQHGFRIAANIKRALEGEFYFYAQIFGFFPADTLEPLEIFAQSRRQE